MVGASAAQTLAPFVFVRVFVTQEGFRVGSTAMKRLDRCAFSMTSSLSACHTQNNAISRDRRAGKPMKVFLSHAAEDQRIAAEVCLALRGAGHEVFFDVDDLPPGGDYNSRIREAIDNSDAVVFLLSPQSLEAGSYCGTERKFARQKWPRPWGRVLPVIVTEVDWAHIDPYLAACTVLKPEGNCAAEVVDGLARMVALREATEPAARAAAPLLALQAAFAAGMLLAWLALALAFGFDQAMVHLAGAVVLAVALLAATGAGVVAAAAKRRDASIRSMTEAVRRVTAKPVFAVTSATLFAAAMALIAWQLASWNRVTFASQQDIELMLADVPDKARSLGIVKAGTPREMLLRTGTRNLFYRRIGDSGAEIGVVEPVVVPPVWSSRQVAVVQIAPLQTFGGLRREGD